MATKRFYGKIGYGQTVEASPGVWKDVITEFSYFGDVIRNSRRMDNGAKVNDDLSVSNSISIVADPYANDNFFAMRYVEWAGALWVVSNVEVQSPRLVLTLGGVYNGPKASAPSGP
jgi:hypothetical protein